MPKLSLFRKRLNIASDDFVYSGSIEVLLRLFGLLIVVIEFSRHHHELDCSGGHLITAYLLGLIKFFCVTIVLDVVIVWVSMKGTIVNDFPRRRMPTLLYTRMVVLVAEFTWTVLGTISIIQGLSICDVRVYWLAVAAVIGGWLTAVCQGMLVLAFFDFNSGEHQSVITTHDWEKRWKSICCCLNTEETKHVFVTLSRLCSLFFKREQLVGSDIMAGLILVYKQQKLKRQQLDVVDAPLISGRLRCKPQKLARSPSIPQKGWMTFQEAAHFMKFALGSYGWFYYIGLNNPVIATCTLMSKLSWYSKHHPLYIEKDGRLMANTAAFMLQTGSKLQDIVCASFHNEVYSIPFFVSIDDESKSIIVSVRGTLSLEDILTDLVVERVPITVNRIDGYVHMGMYQSAKYIKNRLLTEDILAKAFARAQQYRLVITGHSLGAGVAALLSLELRPLYTDLVCFAFAPPGELVSENLIPYTEEFIFSVALGYDVVPRLGLLEIVSLRLHILEAILDCHMPKHEILASGIWLKIFGKHTEFPDTHDEKSMKQRKWFEGLIEQVKKERDHIKEVYIPLLPPGQILHVLEEISPNRHKNVPPDYYAEWTGPETFKEIILSHRMIAHHFPDTLLDALRQLADHEQGIVTKKER